MMAEPLDKKSLQQQHYHCYFIISSCQSNYIQHSATVSSKKVFMEDYASGNHGEIQAFYCT